jgi:hypothetical protein
LKWSYQSQLKRYQEFSHQRKIPVFIDIKPWFEDAGIEIPESFMFINPFESASTLRFTKVFFTKYECNYDKPFFWKKEKLL